VLVFDSSTTYTKKWQKVSTIAIAKHYLACKKIIIIYLIMAGLNKDMGFRGLLSYLNNKIYVVVMGPNTELRIQAQAGGIARLYFTDNNGNGTQAPNGFTLTDVQGNVLPSFLINGSSSYFVTWANSYEMRMNGQRFGGLTTQKQAIDLDRNYHHYVI
ncbi:3310_t:CDS:2, partial [Paraglomus brasilianum]